MAAGGKAQLHDTEAQYCRCRYCGREVAAGSRQWRDCEPFCSERCRLADLDRWFEGEYRVSGRPVDEEDDAAGGPREQ